ncbi:MAG: xylulokinase [Opitutales bacterium]|nr:xylulokinase [Opitutales bacterium]
MQIFVGIDIGSSSTKLVAVDETGKVVFVTAPEYSFQTPKPLWAESDPEDWWTATCSAMKALLEKVPAESIAGIGLTGQMHGLVLLDGAGQVLRPCIMWNDQRTAEQCDRITERVGREEVLRITGSPILPGFTAPKAVWVQEHEPEVWAKVAQILLPKDYIRFRLSSVFATEVSDASGMSLIDVGKRDWSPTMLDACGIRREQCPQLTESTAVSAKVSSDAAAATGLKSGTPIIAGGGDQAAGAIGCGIVKPGIVSCTLGTSGVLFAHSESYKPDAQGRLHTFCSAVPGKWHFMGVQLSSAGSYQWFRNKLAPGVGYDDLNEEAAAVTPGSEGLQFLPYLTGERTPHPDPLARGSFCGLTLRHGRGHMARAVIEGVSFGLRDGLEIMQSLGIHPSRIIASGGGARSQLWRQMLADIFHTPIVTLNISEGAAYGAAMLASVGCGAQSSVETVCANWLGETSVTNPSDAQDEYDAHYQIFRSLYPALKTVFAATAQLDR